MIVKKPPAKLGPAGLQKVLPRVGKSPLNPPVAPVKEERATKSVTTRMPPASLDMLDSIVASYESDRSEVIKRAIRHVHACLSGYNTVVTITDRAGNAKELHLVIDGVPT